MIANIIIVFVFFHTVCSLSTDPRTIFTLEWNSTSSNWEFVVLSKTLTVSFMSSGRGSTLIITNEGKLYGYGLNEYGELGLGHTNDMTSFVFIMNGVSRVCSMSNATAILTSGGELYTAGSNGNGELGRDISPSTFSSTFSLVVDTNLVLRGKGKSEGLHCDSQSAYVVKESDTNHLYSWGKNSLIDSQFPVDLGVDCLSKSLSCDRYLCTVLKSTESNSDYYAWGEAFVLVNNQDVNVSYLKSSSNDTIYDPYILSSLSRQVLDEFEIAEYIYNRKYSVFIGSNGTVFISGVFDYGNTQSISRSSVFSLQTSPHIPIGKIGLMEDKLVIADSYSCYGKYDFEVDSCFGNGYCENTDACLCDEEGSGPRCVLECHGYLGSDYDNVCGGHGVCVVYDICVCTGGYFPSVTFGDCDSWLCGDYLENDPRVCNKRGTCVHSDECECLYNYEGNLCQLFSCEFISTDPKACSGHGKCIGPDMCACNAGYRGKWCRENSLVRSVGGPMITFAGLGFGVFVFICCICCVCCVCCLISLILFLCCGIFVLSSYVSIQKIRMRKFGKLKNLDLLLTEQELEKDTSIAHIRISADLFKIEYSEIKVLKILGEGGSNATVFKAEWKGQIVAFKCFKTRFICSDQDSFNEFEREVEILASVSHPNVISFYGATMNPPRVGIIMEFCENGDLVVFLKHFREENGMKYPFNEKMRFLHEIIMALDYLHGRNIIHRDLKLENVLVKEDETTKLMDFGLSKLVNSKTTFQTKMIGTSFYMAPEIVHKDGAYDEKCDIFSFAILAWMIITEEEDPYEGKVMGMIEMKVANDPTLRPSLERLENEIPKPKEKKEIQGGYRRSILLSQKKPLRWLVHMIVKSWDHDSTKRSSFSELNELFSEKWVNRKEQNDDDDDIYNEKILNTILSSREKGVKFEKVIGKEVLEIQEQNKKLEKELETLEKELIEADGTLRKISQTTTANDDDDDIFQGVKYERLNEEMEKEVKELEIEIEVLKEKSSNEGINQENQPSNDNEKRESKAFVYSVIV